LNTRVPVLKKSPYVFRIEPMKKIARSLREHRRTDRQLFSRLEAAFQRRCGRAE